MKKPGPVTSIRPVIVQADDYLFTQYENVGEAHADVNQSTRCRSCWINLVFVYGSIDHGFVANGSSKSDDEPLFPNIVESSSSKRKKSKDVANNRSTKSKTSSFEEKLDVVLDALSTKSTQTFPPNNPSPTIADCMDIVITFPGFDEGSKKYSQALRVFIKKQNREAFMYPTTDEAKMEFLKLLMEE
ncbi:hypothetical protein L1987_58229 [Smallanthus sonchifolius]|uniref:Uncharacterized protein n=1 Tax=Smallanthus sonchifolius TaxID=185202 RepID=A0ACB9DF11_9ASTR|nr:hypothetical protein L1987_58229 [Smallanthus sonchifolius]